MSTKRYPVIPLRDIVVFPHMVVTLFVGRKRSIEAIHAALAKDSKLFLVAQKRPESDSPPLTDLYQLGVVAQVTQMIHLPDGTVKILVEGLTRGQIVSFDDEADYSTVEVDVLGETMGASASEAFRETLLKVFLEYADYNKKITSDFLNRITQETEESKVIDLIASQLALNVHKQQNLLETVDLRDRLEKVLAYTLIELDALKLEEKVRSRVKQQMEKNHREYYLSEQMKAIQSELHPEQTGPSELDQLKKRIASTKFPKDVRERADAEWRKLSNMNAMSSEASIVRNYLEWLLDLPWGKPSKLKRDMREAAKILDRDHYALDKVKDRILEHLAVQKRLGKSAGQILCLVGPPGVGKTSLGQSVAEATGRQFVRIALGGIRDEAEIRGHRRTYIGAMPGRLIQGMKKAKSSNPLILLDEVDKMGSDWRGDPASALLEVLDPTQNKSFNDHYLEIDYDLSDVFFIATANSLNMPRPLLDRMEILHIPGYTEEEKAAIARKHLISKQIQANGLKAGEFDLTETSLKELIRHYTNESGVRGLERKIGTLARKGLKDILDKKTKKVHVTPRVLKKYLGAPRYQHGMAEKDPLVGVTTGLAWMETGGDLLTIEASVSEGKGKSYYTGKLGEVMQESIQASLSYIRSRAAQFGIPPASFGMSDIHIHVPAGATPKDGPSAGLAICTSVISVLTGIPVRSDVAMTGEITLRGRVLPIGGLKEKLLAAARGGIKQVFIPDENARDLEDVPASIKRHLTITLVKDIEEVLNQALIAPLEPLPLKGQKAGEASKSPLETGDFQVPGSVYKPGVTGSKSKPPIAH